MGIAGNTNKAAGLDGLDCDYLASEQCLNSTPSGKDFIYL